jgi:hypothetical protein
MEETMPTTRPVRPTRPQSPTSSRQPFPAADAAFVAGNAFAFDLDVEVECGPLVQQVAAAQQRVSAAEVAQLDALVELVETTLRVARAHRRPAGAAGAYGGAVTESRRVQLDVEALQTACAVRLGLSEATVARLTDLGIRLRDQLPATRAAWRSGSITRRHVEVIDRATGSLSAEETAQLEARLLDLAVGGVDADTVDADTVDADTGDADTGDADTGETIPPATPARLRREAIRLRESLRADTLQARHDRAAQERRVVLSPADDGMAWLSAFMPAADAAAVFSRTRQIAVRLRDAESEAACGQSTVAQYQADVLRDLLVHGVVEDSAQGTTQKLVPDATPDDSVGADSVGAIGADGPPDLFSSGSSGSSDSSTGPGHPGHRIAPARLRTAAGGVRAVVHVTVPALTLLGQDATPGRIDGVQPIDPETARRLAAGSSAWTRILTDPADGAILDYGRTRYRPPVELTRFVRVRDETCRFPGCQRQAAHCEIDHTLDWQYSGPTAPENLACLCRRHHVFKHSTGWTVSPVPGHPGHLAWRTPAGQHLATKPPGKPTSMHPGDPTGPHPGGPHPGEPASPHRDLPSSSQLDQPAPF